MIKSDTTARVYWSVLFDDYKRSDDQDNRNSALNYGYAIIRSIVIRAICVSGLLPSIGIHHNSELNEFNLADDFIEPIRPIVDGLVLKNEALFKNNLETKGKKLLLNLQNEKLRIRKDSYQLYNALELMLSGFKLAIQKNDVNEMFLPTIDE